MDTSISYDKKGNVKTLKLKINPEPLTLNWPSENGILYLMEAIEKEMIKDCNRKGKQQKVKND